MTATPAASPSPVRPDVSVLVVNYNTAHLLREMWDALMKARHGLSIEVIIVDNASRDDSVSRLKNDRTFASAKLIVNERNVGFGRANNQAMALATGRHVLLLNTDAFIAEDTLTKTVAYLDADPHLGLLGVRLVGRDGEMQPCCRYFPTPWNVFLWRSGLNRFFPGTRMVDDFDWDHASPRECDWVPGCYLLARKEVIDQVGLFDPRFFLYCEEVDFCRRAKQAGWKLVFYPETSVVHLGGESAKSDAKLTAGKQISALQIESELLYFRKHYGLLGLAGFVLLAWCADGVNALKSLLKQRSLRALKPIGEHARTLATLLFKTRIGAVATR